MKTKIFGFLGSAAFVLISSTSFAQLGVGVQSATKATAHINTGVVNNAVSKTKTVTNNTVTKVKEVPSKTVTKVKDVQPNVRAEAGISTATQVSSAGNNSRNHSHGNGNSETGTTILTSGQTNTSVNGDASAQNATDEASETKTKIKNRADDTKTKVKDDTKKVKEKLRKQNHGLEVSTEAKAQGELKRQNK